MENRSIRVSMDGVGLDHKSSRIQKEERIKPKESQDRSENYHEEGEIVKQEDKLNRTVRKRLRIDVRKIKWNKKFDYALKLASSRVILELNEQVSDQNSKLEPEHAKEVELNHDLKPAEELYKCDICENDFKSRRYLQEHMITHTGEKPHKCNICEMKFSCNSNFRSHMRTHTGEKPHKCNICEKKFVWKSDVSKHMRTHTAINAIYVK